MEWKLVGFVADHDTKISDDMRVVQLGPGGDWNSFIFFSDPDGNSWAVQERPAGR